MHSNHRRWVLMDCSSQIVETVAKSACSGAEALAMVLPLLGRAGVPRPSP